MAKHGKNSTANPVYSHYERKRDSKESGFGTIEKRLCGESMQRPNHCSLTNQKCLHPVVTPQGYLYDKENLIKYILKKKEQIKAKNNAYTDMALLKKYKKKEIVQESLNKKKEDFLKNEDISKRMVGKSSKKSSESSLHSSEKHLPCFWIPSLAPEAEEEASKPSLRVVTCPFSGKPLKLSKVLDVKFKTCPENENVLICAATGDVITISTPCAVLTTTGDVVTQQYINKILKVPGDTYMICPFTGKRLEEKNIIRLKCGGSWYAGCGDTHTAKMITPAMLIS